MSRDVRLVTLVSCKQHAIGIWPEAKATSPSKYRIALVCGNLCSVCGYQRVVEAKQNNRVFKGFNVGSLDHSVRYCHIKDTALAYHLEGFNIQGRKMLERSSNGDLEILENGENSLLASVCSRKLTH